MLIHNVQTLDNLVMARVDLPEASLVQSFGVLFLVFLGTSWACEQFAQLERTSPYFNIKKMKKIIVTKRGTQFSCISSHDVFPT